MFWSSHQSFVGEVATFRYLRRCPSRRRVLVHLLCISQHQARQHRLSLSAVPAYYSLRQKAEGHGQLCCCGVGSVGAGGWMRSQVLACGAEVHERPSTQQAKARQLRHGTSRDSTPCGHGQACHRRSVSLSCMFYTGTANMLLLPIHTCAHAGDATGKKDGDRSRSMNGLIGGKGCSSR